MFPKFLTLLAASAVLTIVLAPAGRAAEMQFVGTQTDIGGTFFPGGNAPYVVVPWRSEAAAKTLDLDGNDVYGTDGYALYGTTATWPDANEYGGSDNVNPTEEDPLFPNVISLPSYVAATQVLATKIVSGHPYALVDHPELVNGYRDYNWGNEQSPPVNPANSQSPYLKVGILDGGDILGNSDPKSAPAARWGFEIGEGAPARIRVGVMTDGLNDTIFVPSRLFLTQVVDNLPATTVPSGPLARNRFIDMHFFDIVGAQAGDQFVFAAQAQDSPPWASAGIAGFSFDSMASSGPAADLDGNGIVDGADIVLIQRYLGNAGGPGDLDNNGIVDHLDFNAVVAAFPTSATHAAHAIPEPTTWLMIGVAGLAGLRQTSRRATGAVLSLVRATQ